MYLRFGKLLITVSVCLHKFCGNLCINISLNCAVITGLFDNSTQYPKFRIRPKGLKKITVSYSMKGVYLTIKPVNKYIGTS
jgi:hypothetical protein